MVDLLTMMAVAAIIFGGGFMFFFMKSMAYKKNGLDVILKCIQKDIPIVWVETPSEFYFRYPENEVNDYIFTKYHDIIQRTPGTEKPCRNMGGARMSHASEYLGITMNINVPRIIDYLTKELHWSPDEIRDFLSDLGTGTERKPYDLISFREKLERDNAQRAEGDRLTDDEIEQAMVDADAYNSKINEIKRIKAYVKDAFKTDKKEVVKLYQMISLDDVSKFLATGLNVLRIKTMIDLAVREAKLDSLFKKNDWGFIILIAIAFLIIVVGLGMASSNGLFTTLGNMLNPAAQAAAPVIDNATQVINATR